MESNEGSWRLDLGRIRERLNLLDGLMLHMLAERADLVREVGRIKHAQGESLQASDREAQMFARMKVECERLNLPFDYIAELWSTMIFYSKVMECDAVGINSFQGKKPVPRETLLGNLRMLTEMTAPAYDDYCTGQGADAVRAYRLRERDVIRAAMDGLTEHECALDLGCATGQVAEFLEPRFARVRAFDVSPRMCEEGRNRRRWSDRVTFEETNLHAGIPAEDGSADLVVANFGSASELGDTLLPEVHRVLKPGGRAVLSFYNNEALLNYWFYPWPSTVRARLNRHNGTLEVWTNNNVYTVEAVGTTVSRLKTSLASAGLSVAGGNVSTYPTLQAIVPRFFFSSTHEDAEGMTRIARDLDAALASPSDSDLHHGTYILADVEKR